MFFKKRERDTMSKNVQKKGHVNTHSKWAPEMSRQGSHKEQTTLKNTDFWDNINISSGILYDVYQEQVPEDIICSNLSSPVGYTELALYWYYEEDQEDILRENKAIIIVGYYRNSGTRGSKMWVLLFPEDCDSTPLILCTSFIQKVGSCLTWNFHFQMQFPE